MANTTTPTQTTGTGTGTGTGTRTTWVFDPAHTSVQFSAKHMMVTTVRGHLGPVSGSIQLDENDYTNSIIEVAIDVAGLETRDEKRNAHLVSGDFFDAQKFPAPPSRASASSAKATINIQ